MKKLKNFLTLFLCCMMLATLFNVFPSASAANYSTDWYNYPEPTQALKLKSPQMSGSTVKWFQCAINDLIINGDKNGDKLYSSKLDVDGYFGPSCQTATINFQKKYNLDSDGSFGPASRSKMKEVLRQPQPTTTTPKTSTKTQTIPRTIDDGVYFIRNKLSNKYMDVEYSGAQNGTNIIQYSINGNKNQQFKIEYKTTGYKITPMHCNNMCLDLRSITYSNTNGTDLQLFKSGSYSEQNFQINVMSDGSVEIGSVNSNGNKVLEVTNSSNDDLAIIQIWDRDDRRDNDNWYLEKVDSCCGYSGHIYIQNDQTIGSNTCAMDCLRCHKHITMTKNSHNIDDFSDVYFYYERCDGSHGFVDQAMSKINNKKQKNNFRNIYVFRFLTVTQFSIFWNDLLPERVRNIYYYGHEYSSGTLEFMADTLSLDECFDTEYRQPRNHNITLKTKQLSGEFYLFTCNAGTYIDAPDCLLWNFKNRDTAKNIMNNIFNSKFSTLRFFAYICPNADVMGIKDDGIDYDSNPNGVILPTPHIPFIGGKFVVEHYNPAEGKLRDTRIDNSVPNRYYNS